MDPRDPIEEPEEAEEHTRVDDLWFSNDTLVIKAGKKMFRVSKSILAARSTVFQDMLAFPQPGGAEGELVDGSPVVILHDSGEDVEVFLRAIFDSSYFMPPPEPTDFDAAMAILRLSQKYDIPYLHRRALQHLSCRNPTDLHHGPYIPDDKPMRSLHIVTAATEVGALWLLPFAYYLSSTYDPATIISSGVSDDVVRKCLIGQTDLVRASMDVGRFSSTFPVDQCTTRTMCEHLRKTISSAFFTVVGKQQDTLALHKWYGKLWEQLRDAMCSPCYAEAYGTYTESLDAVWDRLPAIFGLPPWEELRAMKKEALGEEN
ncbi:hypothetical protein C8R43DRAFT_1048701 [Mycena crocata]|nr:hypothetical protein C8R43DRAFT_1048701 [Mycena crocata]